MVAGSYDYSLVLDEFIRRSRRTVVISRSPAVGHNLFERRVVRIENDCGVQVLS